MKYFMLALPILFVTIDEENNKIHDNYDSFIMVTCRISLPLLNFIKKNNAVEKKYHSYVYIAKNGYDLMTDSIWSMHKEEVGKVWFDMNYSWLINFYQTLYSCLYTYM